MVRAFQSEARAVLDSSDDESDEEEKGHIERSSVNKLVLEEFSLDFGDFGATYFTLDRECRSLFFPILLFLEAVLSFFKDSNLFSLISPQ